MTIEFTEKCPCDFHCPVSPIHHSDIPDEVCPCGPLCECVPICDPERFRTLEERIDAIDELFGPSPLYPEE